jgi:hypothetical protein
VQQTFHYLVHPNGESNESADIFMVQQRDWLSIFVGQLCRFGLRLRRAGVGIICIAI